MKINIDGIELHTNPRGAVLWASDWSALFMRAYEREFGLRLESGGPST